MKSLQLFMLMLLGTVSLAGDYTRPLGRISIEELESPHYEKDLSAEASVLHDYGVVEFIQQENGFEMVFTRHRIVKIYNNSGIRHGDIEIPFYKKDIYMEEDVEIISAVTYNLENGVIVETSLNKTDYHTEKVNENIFLKKFAMPDVRSGSVVEYQYTLSSPFFFNLPDWHFQDVIPTAFSMYETRIIPFYEYVYLLQGAENFDIHENFKSPGLNRQFGSVKFKDIVYKFGMNDVPAFQDEDFITSMEDFIIKIDFQLAAIHDLNGGTHDVITTWPALSEDLLGDNRFGRYIKKAGRESRDIIKALPLSGLNEEEKYRMLIEYVKTNIDWNGNHRIKADRHPNEVLETKIGSSAEINLFLVALLKEAGFEDASPVILSTRNNGKINKTYPVMDRFNYVIVITKLGDNYHLSDGTANYLAYNRISSQCLNQDNGLVISKSPMWVPLQNKVSSRHQIAIETNLDTTKGLVNYTISHSASEYEGAFFRSDFQDDHSKVEEYALQNDMAVTNVSTEAFHNISSPYQWKYEWSTTPQVAGEKQMLTIFPENPIADSPFKNTSRKYPIDLHYGKHYIFSNTIKLPEGYTVDYKPEEVSIDNELVTLNLSFLKSANSLTAIFNFKVKESIYPATDYQELKEYYSKARALLNEVLVIQPSLSTGEAELTTK